ncbi:MAG: fibronectin type III domain-containing protein [Elusimicrobia bacterium]|nr:fibronectin type III domain-containing protein [Elusimicrobiota bacterium]
MKKIFVLSFVVVLATILYAAGLRFGMTGAVKEKIKKLDEKVSEKKVSAPEPTEIPAPTDLTAVVISSAQINLSWQHNANNLSLNGFKIERSTNATNFTQIITVTQKNYNDTGLTAATTYWYRLRAYNSAGDSDYSNVASTRTSLVIPAPSLFGMGPQVWLSPTDYITSTDVVKLNELKPKWIRLDIIWNNIEAKEGVFNFSETDRQVNALSESGFGIAAALFGTPKYASAAINPETVDLNTSSPKFPEYKSQYITYVQKVVSRYKDKIKYWIIGNEPNDWWDPTPSPTEYVVLLSTAYKTIKEIDKDAKVILGTVGPVFDAQGYEVSKSTNYYPYMEYTYKVLDDIRIRNEENFDIIGMDPYRLPKGPDEKRDIILENGQTKAVTFKEEMLEFKRLFNSFGHANKKLWFGELGWLANDTYTGDRTGFVSESKQAEFLEQVYSLVKNDIELNFIEVIFWYNLRDSAPELQYGLMKADYTPKPAFETYKKLAGGN